MSGCEQPNSTQPHPTVRNHPSAPLGVEFDPAPTPLYRVGSLRFARKDGAEISKTKLDLSFSMILETIALIQHHLNKSTTSSPAVIH
jgi:hypothetical protein